MPEKPASIHPGWVTLVVVTTLLGLIITQVASQRSFAGDSYAPDLFTFTTGLCLVFVPVAARLCMRRTGRLESVALVLLLGAAFYIVKIQGSPYQFTGNDEFIHLQNTQQILATRRLFQFNPLLTTAPYYPGLAAVTVALIDLTGLSTFVAGLIVIGVMRLVISACIFLVAEKATSSTRAAAVASLVYVANPMFLFWSGQFAYEDLGLPLAAFTVWWISRTRGTGARSAQLLTTILLLAITVTHHISAVALTCILLLWFFVELAFCKSGPERTYVAINALLMGASFTIWFLFVARPATSYLIDQNLKPAVEQISSVINGGQGGRRLYSGGDAPPEWWVLLGVAAIAAIMGALVPGLYRAWRIIRDTGGKLAPRRTALTVAALISISFPFTLLPRLTVVGGAISARSSEYVFLGVGCILGLLAMDPRDFRDEITGKSSILTWAARAWDFAFSGWQGTLLLLSLTVLLLLGEITIGNAYNDVLPPPLNASGYPGIVQPDIVAASVWAEKHLGKDQWFAASWIDSLALAVDGSEYTQQGDDIISIFVSTSLAGASAQTIRETGTHYVLVDWRMTQGTPSNPGDYYFSQWEPDAGQYTKPLPSAYLQKFSTYSCTHLVYRNGPLDIYDVSSIANGSCVPKLLTPAANAKSPLTRDSDKKMPTREHSS